MYQTRSIAIACKNLFCVIPVIQNGWLSAIQFQVPISWGGPLTASDKDRCPCTLLSHFQVSLGSESGPLTTCHSLAGWDCWKENAASKLLMPPNAKPLISGIQVLLLLHHSDPLYELRNSCFVPCWFDSASVVDFSCKKWITKYPEYSDM